MISVLLIGFVRGVRISAFTSRRRMRRDGGPIHGCSGCDRWPAAAPSSTYSIVKDPKKPRLRPRAKLTLVSARLSWDAPWLSTRYCHVKAESMEFII